MYFTAEIAEIAEFVGSLALRKCPAESPRTLRSPLMEINKIGLTQGLAPFIAQHPFGTGLCMFSPAVMHLNKLIR